MNPTLNDPAASLNAEKPTFSILCARCQSSVSFDPLQNLCQICGSDWRFAGYDLPHAAEIFSSTLRNRRRDLWRYAELLPLRATAHPEGMGEGWTPLFPARQLGLLLGLENLYIKDERQSPTRSFKDRQAAITTAILREHEVQEAVVCSTGNVAMAFSASCAHAGIKLWAFLTSLVPPEKMREVAIYGTKVIKVTGTYDEAKKLASEFADQRNLYLDRGVRSIAAVESMKTIAFEIAEQLPIYFPADSSAWRAPDWYIQAVSGGVGPIGVLKGFRELSAMGLIGSPPALGIIQAAGCAPMVKAWKAGRTEAKPVLSPKTHITTLTTGDPGKAYTHLYQQLRDSGRGVMESVSDEEAFRALHLIAKLEGISVEPAAAAAFAGLIKLARQGVLRRQDVIVVNCSGHAMPVEPELLKPDWALDIDAHDFRLPDQPSEGLLSALGSLTDKITSDILIVDDQADARRLIRRVLEAQGSYSIREAANGPAALAHFESRRPDVVILDLMMPDMDGFQVLEAMKARAEGTDVPVIVVTAKELSADEQRELEGRIKGLFVKGDFLGDDLVDRVDTLLD